MEVDPRKFYMCPNTDSGNKGKGKGHLRIAQEDPKGKYVYVYSSALCLTDTENPSNTTKGDFIVTQGN
jgi:hypothetical protein